MVRHLESNRSKSRPIAVLRGGAYCSLPNALSRGFAVRRAKRKIHIFQSREGLPVIPMSRHQYDLVQCMKQPGTQFGLVCAQCDGRCPLCDSFVKPTSHVRVCRECSQGHVNSRCILCSSFLGNDKELGTPAYYCLECVRTEKDREGCPRVMNVGSSRSDMIFNKKKANLTVGRLSAE